MKSRTMVAVAAAVAAGSLSWGALAQQGTAGGSPSSSSAQSGGSGSQRPAQSSSAPDSKAGKGAALSSADRSFVTKAAEGGLAEVATGKLAASNSGSDEVKKFGQKMVDDHGKANDELKQIAESKGVKLPTQPDPAHQKAAKKLEAQKGAAFDKAYLQAMVKDHDATVKLFKNEAAKGKDADLKSFAEKTLATLQQHDDMAHQLANAKGNK